MYFFLFKQKTAYEVRSSDWSSDVCSSDLTFQQDSRLSTDTRKLSEGQMFLALKGEAYDGHDYLATALEAGACAAIVQRHDAAVDLPQIGKTSGWERVCQYG